MSKPSPLINIAAIAVIVATLAAVGAIMGIIPSPHSQRHDGERNKEGRKPFIDGARRLDSIERRSTDGLQIHAHHDTLDPCSQCGVIETVRSVEVPGKDDAFAVGGGAVADVPFGSANDRLVGVAAGLYEGHTIEKTLRKRTSHRVTVRMDDGSARTIYQSSPPAFGIGERVRLINGTLAANG